MVVVVVMAVVAVVVVMAVVAVVVVMAVMAVMVVMAVMTVMTVMAVMAVMAAAVHQVTAAVTAAVTATMTAGVRGGGGESRHADSNRCGKGEDCNALEHFSGSFGSSAGDHPRVRASVSLKPRRPVPAITIGECDAGGCKTRLKGRER